jgi:hypothetical protein
MKRWLACAISFAVFAAGAAALAWFMTRSPRNSAANEDWFEDVTESSGITFVHDAGELGRYQQPQIHGSGLAIFDFDGDGLLDIYFLTQGGPQSSSINRLYKNMGGGKFKDVTEGSGLGFAGENTGVAIGDVNNDGFPDVLVTQVGGVKLFLNNGDGTFTDITEESGLKNPLWATSACFVDFDRDGWLDLVVVNYLKYDPNSVCYGLTSHQEYCGPLTFPGTVSKLFRNLGKSTVGGSRSQVRFQDVTVSAGLAKAPGPGLGVYCADFTGDGWPDIFIANDGKPNHLWVNQKNGTFQEESFARGIASDSMGQTHAGMGVAIGDVNGDGLFDVYVTHLTSEHNTLWVQGPKRGNFRDRTAQSSLLNSDWRGTGFGTLMGDFDNDGWLDVAIVNGRIARGTLTPNPARGSHLTDYCERNQIFRNEGSGVFKDVSNQNRAFCGTPDVTRGLACGDLDGDGGLDLVVSSVAGRARVYHNAATGRGHWLIVRALDPQLHRDAYGAELVLNCGERKMLRIVNSGGSFQCSSDPRAHFGLGSAARFDSIRVLWPDGLEEEFPGDSADKVVTLSRGSGRTVARSE